MKRWQVWGSFGVSAVGVLLSAVMLWEVWLPVDFPPLALLGVFFPFLAAPAMIMLILALWIKSRGGFFFNGLVLAGLLVFYGPCFLPQRSSTVFGSSSAMRVMTFNLRYEYYDPADLTSTILLQGADVVAVQEVAPSVMPDLMAGLGESFQFVVPVSPLSDLALFSRYPIVASEWFCPAGDGQGALHAVLDIEGRPWHIFAVHPLPAKITRLGNTFIPTGLHYGNLEAQMADVLERARVIKEPLVVLGDFNMAERSRTYRLISRQLIDTFHEAGQGLGFTFPQDVWIDGWQIPGPFVRLDYIFHSAGILARDARVVCEGASDHCLVTADLALQP